MLQWKPILLIVLIICAWSYASVTQTEATEGAPSLFPDCDSLFKGTKAYSICDKIDALETYHNIKSSNDKNVIYSCYAKYVIEYIEPVLKIEGRYQTQYIGHFYESDSILKADIKRFRSIADCK